MSGVGVLPKAAMTTQKLKLSSKEGMKEADPDAENDRHRGPEA